MVGYTGGLGPDIAAGRLYRHIKAAGRAGPGGGNGGGTHIDIGKCGTCARLGAIDYNAVEQNAQSETGVCHEGHLIGG